MELLEEKTKKPEKLQLFRVFLVRKLRIRFWMKQNEKQLIKLHLK
jgi:hypothetical protein